MPRTKKKYDVEIMDLLLADVESLGYDVTTDDALNWAAIWTTDLSDRYRGDKRGLKKWVATERDTYISHFEAHQLRTKDCTEAIDLNTGRTIQVRAGKMNDEIVVGFIVGNGEEPFIISLATILEATTPLRRSNGDKDHSQAD